MFNPFRRPKKVQPPIVTNTFDDEEISSFVLQWNIQYPIDRWFRQKHKIPFGSPQHRVLSFIDMRFEWEEDLLFFKNEQTQKYVPNKGDWMKVTPIVDEDADLTEAEKLEKYKREFAEMDLDQYKVSK